MATVVSEVLIAGAIEPVFDLITSARFWPQWHPATRATFGVRERPYQEGDLIHESVQFASHDLVVSWLVAEHARPSRVLLNSLTSKAQIRYDFETKGDAVAFRRELEYDDALLRRTLPSSVDLDTLMRSQSDEGTHRLKDLVERILREESIAPPGGSTA